MPFYRKKPVVIEARQFLKPPIERNHEEIFSLRGDPAYLSACDAEIKAAEEIQLWLQAGGAKFECTNDAMGACILINTPEGQMRADPGDWIIRGVKGEFYPCKPDIFNATYEVAEGAR
ncbi:MAG: hypothetical protein LCH61_01925 [Proteobacteria bacterium]|nr:hypothetical protein [Pseudomonadota bacterium]